MRNLDTERAILADTLRIVRSQLAGTASPLVPLIDDSLKRVGEPAWSEKPIDATYVRAP